MVVIVCIKTIPSTSLTGFSGMILIIDFSYEYTLQIDSWKQSYYLSLYSSQKTNMQISIILIFLWTDFVEVFQV